MFFKATVVAALLSSVCMVQAAPTNATNLAASALATVITKCSVKNTAALTFDDGPYKYLKEISDTLTNAGAKGTFFLNGNNYDCIYSATNVKNIKYAYGKGHQFASHTWAHKDLTTLSLSSIKSEMSKVDTALQRIIGVTPAFVRPPYGNYNNNVRTAAASRGEKVVIWDFDSGDSVGKTTSQSNKLYDDLAKKHPSNVLALNHEVYPGTAHTVLPHAISVLKAKGYKLVTLAECLGQAPYQKVVTPPKGTWSC